MPNAINYNEFTAFHNIKGDDELSKADRGIVAHRLIHLLEILSEAGPITTEDVVTGQSS